MGHCMDKGAGGACRRRFARNGDSSNMLPCHWHTVPPQPSASHTDPSPVFLAVATWLSHSSHSCYTHMQMGFLASLSPRGVVCLSTTPLRCTRWNATRFQRNNSLLVDTNPGFAPAAADSRVSEAAWRQATYHHPAFLKYPSFTLPNEQQGSLFSGWLDHKCNLTRYPETMTYIPCPKYGITLPAGTPCA
jgi:hypothetical protein